VFGNQFIGNVAIDGRTVEGRFARQLARELTEHLGPPLSVVQKLMVRQIVTMQLQMIVLNQKQALDPDSWTDHDRRCLNALSNQFRLGLKALGLGAAGKPARRGRPSMTRALAKYGKSANEGRSSLTLALAEASSDEKLFYPYRI
jgi:hypothetical protein